MPSSGQGSPPRMRGKDFLSRVLFALIRITPAYAGKSGLSSKNILQVKDHPRVCGEKLSGCVWQQACAGSPPRMRGKEGQPGRVERGTGITPAYAGKRTPTRKAHLLTRDHPRVCGEKIVFVIVFCSLMGSPPRMRGKAALSASAAGSEGITPAYAGKRQCSRPPAGGHQDHPRVCGEKSC